MAQDPTSIPGNQGTPVQRAADAAARMTAAGEKVTVSAVRTRAGVSMEAARQGVEQWRNDSRPPEVPMPEAVQRAFATAWAAAATEAAARFEADRQAAQQLVEAAQTEAAEAGRLVDAEAERADAEAARADAAANRIGELERQLTEQVAKHEKYQQAMAEALDAERTNARTAAEAVAEARGRLAVLQEQAERYWDKKDTQSGKKSGK